jgi:hypothetical protein
MRKVQTCLPLRSDRMPLRSRWARRPVPLYGPWRFTVGDSPIDPRTGQPLWAEPGFDDSHWETVDLTP